MQDPNLPEPTLSIVTPMFNEEVALARYFEAVRAVLDPLDLTYEIVCVNDGSRDGTLDRLAGYAREDARIKVVDLSRNFGKEAALTAGLELAAGRAVIPLDADLQEPPELIPAMVEAWREGYEVVLARRSDRSLDSRAKAHSAKLYYRLLRWLSEVEIPENVGDFRLMDRRVVEALARLPERTRFMKGIFAWLGFRQTVLTFARPRRLDGEGKQGLRSLFRLALNGILSFSSVPLRMWTYLGLLTAMTAGVYMVYTILKTLILGVDTPGFATIVTVLLFFNGLLMINLGIIGEYLARIFVEVKGRPVYIVRDTTNIAHGAGPRAEPRVIPRAVPRVAPHVAPHVPPHA